MTDHHVVLVWQITMFWYDRWLGILQVMCYLIKHLSTFKVKMSWNTIFRHVSNDMQKIQQKCLSDFDEVYDWIVCFSLCRPTFRSFMISFSGLICSSSLDSERFCDSSPLQAIDLVTSWPLSNMLAMGPKMEEQRQTLSQYVIKWLFLQMLPVVGGTCFHF